MEITNSMKQKLIAEEPVLGMMVFELVTPGMPYILGRAGLDFAIFDMEATSLSWDSLRTLCLGSHAAGITPIVRLPSIWPDTVGRALDLGLMGIMAPKVDSAEEAANFARYAKFPPQGARGSGHGLMSGAPSGMPAATRHQVANENVMLFCQIESPQGVEETDRIASVEGIDVLSIGINDLTAALGAPGDFQNPDFIEAVQHVRTRTAAHGKWFAGGVRDPRRLPEALANGQQISWTKHDIAMLGDGAKAYVDVLKQHRAS